MATAVELVVSEILDQFAEKHDGNAPPDHLVTSIVNGVIAAGHVSITGLSPLSAVAAIDEAVKLIQSINKKPITGLLELASVDKAVEFLKNLCSSKPAGDGTGDTRVTIKSPPDPGADPVLADIASRTFVYSIEGSLPQIKPDPGKPGPAKQAAQLIDEAFFEWLQIINIRTNQLDSKLSKSDIEGLANLNLKATEIDGPSGQLALSTFNIHGQKGVLQGNLEMNIDPSEDWTESMFKSAMIHEIGHLLGLDHEPDQNSIMYFQLTGATSLSTSDPAVVKALGVWGKSNLPTAPDRIRPLV